eukprot:jgi/Tetstr1/456715/TSEL_004132.t1
MEHCTIDSEQAEPKRVRLCDDGGVTAAADPATSAREGETSGAGGPGESPSRGAPPQPSAALAGDAAVEGAAGNCRPPASASRGTAGGSSGKATDRVDGSGEEVAVNLDAVQSST